MANTRPRRSKAWFILAPAALIPLLLVFSTGSTGSSGDRPPVDAITVGVGSTLDRIHYSGTFLGSDSADAPLEESSHALVSELRGTSQTLTAAGEVRPTLLLQERYTFDTSPQPFAWTEHIDLQSKTRVRWDVLTEQDIGGRFHEWGYAQFFWLADGHQSSIGLQGRTLRLGDEFPDARCTKAPSPDELGNRTHREWVDAAGWFDGKPALSVRTEVRMHDDGVSFDHWNNQTRWFVDGQAYPVLIEDRYEELDWEPGAPETAVLWRSYETLHLYTVESKGEPIPWDPRPLDPCQDALLPLAPRSPTHVPSDADTNAWAYPPSAAIRDIKASLVPDVAAWHAAHPRAIVIGLHGFASDAAPAAAPQGRYAMGWHVVFGDGPQFATMMASQLGSSPLAAIQLQGQGSIDAPYETWIHPAPVTFGHAFSSWDKVGAECPGRAPMAYWGLWTPESEVFMEPRSFDEITLTCVTPGATDPPVAAAPSTNRTSVTVFADSGGLRFHSSQYQAASSLLPLPALAGDARGPGVAPAGDPIGPNNIPPLVLWASSALLILVVAAILLKFLASGTLFGYAKIRDTALREHPMRERILRHVAANPGVTPPTLQQQVGVPWSTLTYHLSVMERDSLLRPRVVGRHKYLFVPEGTSAAQRDRLAVLQNDQTRKIMDHVVAHPGDHERALARTFGIDPKAIRWHLRRLEQVKLARSERPGRSRHWFATGPS